MDEVQDAVEALPPELRARSLSPAEIVLDFNDALAALEILRAADWEILGWEGWQRDTEGRVGHHAIQGNMSLSQQPDEPRAAFLDRCKEWSAETMRRDYQEWQASGDGNPQLYFCITATKE
jgi:hypothetical protein